MLARGGMQCDSRLKIVLEIEISETSKKKGPRCPYKKKLLKVKFLNSFTLLYYYIKIIKYNKRYDLLLLFYKLAQKCGILFRKVGNSRSRGRKSAKKVENMKSGENLSISGEQKIIPLCLIRSVV
jgi:hypothetical protein